MGTKRVLVVDDAEVFRTLMTELLARRGYEVVTAKDGLEALDRLSPLPDLVLLDLLLPKMTGFDVLREIRNNEETRKVPVLAVSGVFQEEGHLDVLRSLGANGFVSKSATPSEIADQAVTALEQPGGTWGQAPAKGEGSDSFLWKKPYADPAAALAKMNLFRELSEDQRQKIMAISRRVKFFREQVIIQEGEQGDRFYGIISGKVRVEKKSLSDRPTVIARLLPGQAFGELALVDREHRSATCKAETEVEAIEITREDFERAIKNDPELERKCLRALVKVLTERLRETDTSLTFSRSLIEKIIER